MTADPLPAGQLLAAQRCAACPKMCRAACPTLEVTANERHQPWGHARAAVAALRVAEGFAAPAVVDAAFACATCGACTVPCRVSGVETPELSWAVRAAVFAAGRTPAVGLRAVAEAAAGRVPATETPPGWIDPGATLAGLRELSTPGAPLLLLPGCGTLGRRPAAALAAGRALRTVGVEFAVLDEHRCCGAVAHTFGDTASMAAMLERLGAALAGTGARTLAVQSPACAHQLARRAAAAGPGLRGLEVVPLAEVLAGAVTRRSRPSTGVRVAYHDPCFLARHLDCTAAPRAALHAAGYEVADLRRSRGRTACSGGGGGLPLTHPAIATGYRDRLAADVAAAATGGATALVTGCATCATRLAGATSVPVLELSEAVAAVLDPLDPGEERP